MTLKLGQKSILIEYTTSVLLDDVVMTKDHKDTDVKNQFIESILRASLLRFVTAGDNTLRNVTSPFRHFYLGLTIHIMT